MNFRNPFNNFWKTFYLNPFEIRPLSATCTHKLNTENKHETDRWARDPTCQSQREGGRHRRPQLAGGEISGQANGTMRTTSCLRTQQYIRGGQWSSEGRSPPFMAERWRG
jgi:hypothetical protein